MTRLEHPNAGSDQPPAAHIFPVVLDLLQTPDLQLQPNLKQSAFPSPLALDVFQAFPAALDPVTPPSRFWQATPNPTSLGAQRSPEGDPCWGCYGGVLLSPGWQGT